MSNNNTYVVFIVGDSYLPGVIALKRSLDLVGSAYPLTALTCDCSVSTMETLTGAGINAIAAEAPAIPNSIRDLNIVAGRPRWNQSFAKLSVLALTRFDSVVLLDADMMVLSNIDGLFDAPSMSAVVAGGGAHADWVDLNSGLMVIKPSHALYQNAISLINSLDENLLSNFRDGIGDQDIFQMLLPSWRSEEALHLSERFNAFQDCLAMYDSSGYLNFKDVSVVHFELASKPWTYGIREWLNAARRALHYGSLAELTALRRYRTLLQKHER